MLEPDDLARLSLFADLRASQLEEVAQTLEEERHPRGDRVLREGLSGGGFYIVLDGEVVVRIGDEERARLTAGEFFGEISVLTGEPSSADVVVSSEELRCAILPGPELRPLLLRFPHIAVRMLELGGSPAPSRQRVAVIDDRPFPAGAYDLVVVGSGPGGLQTSYFLQKHGIRHAVLSADDAPGGTFRKWPVFERLLTWSKPDAPFPRERHEYERYDLNSLIADESEHRALVAEQLAGTSVFPSRAEMETGLVQFAERSQITARYGCEWTGTRRDDDLLVLETSDGEYRCRAAVFAVGVTTPWKPPIPGIEDVPHYAETADAEVYRDKSVVMIGKRNSGFELASGLLPRARRIVLVSPQHVRSDVLAAATVRVPYFQPLEDAAHGGSTVALDAAVERVERMTDGFAVHAAGTTQPGPLTIHADAVIAATGFTAPLLDLPRVGVKTVARDRIPALTPFWESTSAPGIFFAGNASQGAPGLRKHGFGSFSGTVQGFRYNARILARHLAERVFGLGSSGPRFREVRSCRC